MSKVKQARITFVIPKALLVRLDRYCDKVIKDNARVRSSAIRLAIESFLDKEGEK